MVQLEALTRRGFGETSRRDNWWISPLLVFLGFAAFIVYSTWAAFQAQDYWLSGTNYLSPFYSPELFGDSPHSWFGPKPSWIPEWAPWSPAFLILWAPGGFRFTCYYYRGAYYKAFWADPVACSVGEPRDSYRGENSLPLILQNVHRYFLYVAIVFIGLLGYDAYKALWFDNPAGGAQVFGIGVGTLVMSVNVILLGCYTFSCHSLRHLIGGGKDSLSSEPARMKAYACVSCINRKHMVFAWLSLFWVGFTDVYVRLCAKGIWHDWRIL
ncbi:MAG: succinate dehydrogenase [Planctomycetota bacterium]|nr:succinate dehydrogenase [Planctomycetota bacterium]